MAGGRRRASRVLALGAGALLAAAPARAQVGGEPPPIVPGRAAPPGTYGDLDVVRYQATLALPGPGGTVVEGDATLTLRPTRAGLDAAVQIGRAHV